MTCGSLATRAATAALYLGKAASLHPSASALTLWPAISLAFNNQRLFSDYFLESVVPTLPEWTAATSEAATAQTKLQAAWHHAEPLVPQHEGQTEEHWVRPVLRELGYAFQVQAAVPDAHGITRWPDYALFASEPERAAAETYAGGAAYFAAALGIADAKVWDAPLDRAATATGAQFDRRNPNYQIDAYLRETGRRWAILTNGRQWRLYLRDTSYRLDSFYEVDLTALLEGDAEEFKYFWLFFRRISLEDQPAAFVDRVRSQSEEFAEALSARVKGRVYEALGQFINGFFEYPANALDPTTDLQATYENSLILLYRILFALYAEAHELLPTHSPPYRDTYSIARIKRDLAERLDASAALLPGANNYYADLKNLFSIIDDGATELGVPPYNGGLFDPRKHPFLARNDIGDAYLARGLDLLARAPHPEGLSFVDYKTLEIRHLGDIYEGLLEYHPRFADVEMVAIRAGRSEIWKPEAERETAETVVSHVAAGTCYLATGRGERRATGSYYTPQHIVQLMIEDSLGRLVADLEGRLQGQALIDALLDLRVCDPAMGSGHFLVEAVDHIARAVVRAGGEAETADEESDLQAAKRIVVERCVYGVDPNPLAVELAKLSLWLATVARDRPLSFVDAHLLRGDSLVGTSVEQMASLRGATGVTQMNFVEEALGRVLPQLLEKTRLMAERESQSVEDVEEKERLLLDLDDLRASFVQTANLWTARHFGVPVTEDSYLHAVTALTDPDQVADRGEESLTAQGQEVAEQFAFHHWELAFPEVFLNGARPRGFDAVVTNPPYVNANERRRAYDDRVVRYWRREFQSAFRAFDLYVLFLELVPNLTRPHGWASVITPNKFLAAPYAQALREATAQRHALSRLIDASRVPVFEDPSVYPVITVFRAHDHEAYDIEVYRLAHDGSLSPHGAHASSTLTRLPESIWAYLLLDEAELLLRLGETHPPLDGFRGMRAVASTATAEADEFGPHLREEHLAPAPGWRVVATGTIRPYSGDWAFKRLTHQGRRFLRPVLSFNAPVVSHARRDQYWAAKLIFKKLCLRLEALMDREGGYASMNTNFVLPGAIDLYALAALFHSRLMSWAYEGYFGALRMGGGYMQVQAPQLRVLPMPPFSDSLSGQELDDLVDGEDALEASLPQHGEAGATDRLYALLRLFGREAQMCAETVYAARQQLATDLIAALGIGQRREQDPAFVLPRQERIFTAVEDFAAPDLAAFWQPMRRTAHGLGVEITGARQQMLTSVVHRARETMEPAATRIAALADRIDEAVYLFYGLTDDDITRVERGHTPPPGVTVDAGTATEVPRTGDDS